MRNYEEKLVDSSRIVADILVEDIGKDEQRFEEMLDLCLRDKYPLSMRASRIISLCCENYPDLITNYTSGIIAKLQRIKVEGVKRGLLKIFAENPPELNDDEIGLLTDLAFTWLGDPKQAVAIRYYCIEIILHVCNKYPDLKKELVILLKEVSKNSSPGIVAKCTMVLDKFQKEGID